MWDCNHPMGYLMRFRNHPDHLLQFPNHGTLPPARPDTASEVIRHLHLLDPITHQAFHKLSKRYRPLIYLRLNSLPAVIASNADIARKILKTHGTTFASRPQSSAIHYLTYGASGFAFAPYGPYWKFMKKLCMSDLLGGRTLDQPQPIRREEIRRFLRLLHKKSNGGEVVDVGLELITMMNNIASTMAISRICSDTEGEAEEVREIVHEMAELVGTFNVSDYIWLCRNLDLQGLKKRCISVGFRNPTDSIVRFQSVLKCGETVVIQTQVHPSHHGLPNPIHRNTF